MTAPIRVELPGHPPAVTPNLARLLLQIVREDAERRASTASQERAA